MTHDGSQKAYERAAVIPGRSLTRSKAPGRYFALGQGPLYAERGSGSTLYDVDGHGYVDMVCGLGAISLGYGVANQRARTAIESGWIYSLPSSLEAEAAHAVLRDVAPWAMRCRFVKTGSESTHAAFRIAKRETGRSRVLMMGDSYHGWHEWCAKKSDGTPEDSHTVLYPYGACLETCCALAGISSRDVAAVFVEPHRWEPTSIGWLQSVRDFCRRNGAVLVFDEMIYGGRWAVGGATEYFGVVPDLACFGKAIGNGAPIACVVGGAALMDAHAEMVSGTYSGDAAALAAVVEVLEFYRVHPVIQTLWARGAQLREGLADAVRAYPDAGAVVEGAAPVHQRLRFLNPARGKLFSAEMVKSGVLFHPDVVNVSYSHSSDNIRTVVTAAAVSLETLTRKAVGA